MRALWWENPDVYVHAPDRKALMFDATFSAPDLDTLCLLDRLGLTATRSGTAR
ncbi:MAG: hypothetical protein ACR2OE_05020 [Thermomicrobiales bacterium]